MLKIFTTQLTGIFSRIQDKESDAIEDGARLLAQAVISGHSIYLYGANELQGVFYEATESSEPFPSVKAFPESAEEVTESDRVLMFCSGPAQPKSRRSRKSFMKKVRESYAYRRQPKTVRELNNIAMCILILN